MSDVLANCDRLGAQVGTGSLGRVYLTAGGDALAYKTLHDDLGEVAALSRAFVEAAQRARALSHPNIVEIVDAGYAESGAAFVITQHYRAPNLAMELDGHELSVDAVCEVGAQLCLALAAAHEQGVLHLDLKPENVLIEWSRAGTPITRVLDFGTAQAVFSHPRAPRSARWAYAAPRHQAPEVLMGRAGRPCSDVYSVGSILYEALCGVPPINGEDEHEALQAALTGDWRPLSQQNAQLPESLVRAIENALINDPDERLSSPLALLRQLLLHVDEDSPVYEQAKRQLARSSTTSEFAATSPSLMLQQVPRPRQISTVPSSRLVSPVFPKSPPAPRIEETMKLPIQRHEEPPSWRHDAGTAAQAPNHRLDLLAVFAGLGAGFALAWLNLMR